MMQTCVICARIFKKFQTMMAMQSMWLQIVSVTYNILLCNLKCYLTPKGLRPIFLFVFEVWVGNFG